ncbi:MAG: undecaprenyldiphospho-muramoylpentapeptide beta-N-acetylglucosaminyltransferase [Salaquimonas sp.]
MTTGTILLAAGGTGGHLFPAEALAHILRSRGYKIVLATDVRGNRFADHFPADKKSVISSATIASKNPIAILKALNALYQGYKQSSQLIKDLKPLAAIGFGGYPTLPPILAASRNGIPCLVHEQNAILGRANKMLASRMKAVAVGFPQVGEVPQVPVIETGNPIRPNVEAVLNTPYPERSRDDPFRLVIFGGSQGARFFSEILPEGVKGLSAKQRSRLSILQQAREEDKDALVRVFDEMGVKAEIAPFFGDLPNEISKAHFVIARAGAGSVTEIAVIGRPSLLIPLPGSLDGDQAANADAMKKANGGLVLRQAELTGSKLAEILQTAMDNPGEMKKMALAAKTTGTPDAAKRLADCVECVISGGEITSLSF